MLDAVQGTLVDKLIGQALFLFAVVPNLVLLVIGVLIATVWLLGALFRASRRLASTSRSRRSTDHGRSGSRPSSESRRSSQWSWRRVAEGRPPSASDVHPRGGPQLVLLAYGVARAAIWLFGAGLGMMATPAVRHAHPDDAFHHPDPISTPAFHQIFMLGAIGLVIVGLPVALGAIFHFVLPLMGEGWGQ